MLQQETETAIKVSVTKFGNLCEQATMLVAELRVALEEEQERQRRNWEGG